MCICNSLNFQFVGYFVLVRPFLGTKNIFFNLSIYENARVAQNQDEYKKRYDGLTARYDKAKSRLDAVTAKIQDKTSRCQAIEYYMKLLREQDTVITAYSRDFWHRMVDFVTVYNKEDIRFTFKDGTEIQA